MQISFNNQILDIPNDSDIAFVLQVQKIMGVFAVALNKRFVPKTQFDTKIQENDTIDIVVPMQGG